MKLGLLVNTDRHLAHIVGLTRAALAKGHQVIIFVMDEGTKLVPTAGFSELCGMAGVTTSFCSYSAKQGGVITGGLSEEMECGSQYHNAVMNHEADRVIVL